MINRQLTGIGNRRQEVQGRRLCPQDPGTQANWDYPNRLHLFNFLTGQAALGAKDSYQRLPRRHPGQHLVKRSGLALLGRLLPGNDPMIGRIFCQGRCEVGSIGNLGLPVAVGLFRRPIRNLLQAGQFFGLLLLSPMTD